MIGEMERELLVMDITMNVKETRRDEELAILFLIA